MIRVKDRRVPTNGHVCITNLTVVDNNVTTIDAIRTQLLYFCRINYFHHVMGHIDVFFFVFIYLSENV